MKFSSIEKNALRAVQQLLQTSKVRVTRRTLEEKLWQHPDFPSLASLSNVLDELHVSNLVTRLPSEQLTGIPLPAIAYLETEGGMLATIHSISGQLIEWTHTTRGRQRESLTSFKQKWNGVTLLVEPDEQSGESDYDENRKREIIESFRYPFAIFGLLACAGCLIALGFRNHSLEANWQLYLLLAVKLIGLVVTGLLVWYDIDSNSLIRKNTQANNQLNYQRILNSKAAKLFDWLSWAEIGLFYFSGGLITLLLAAMIPTTGAAEYLLLFSCIAVPYTLYSVYYQAFVAKEWCLMCMIVQILLWTECMVGFALWTPWPLQFSWQIICLLGFSFLITPALWVVIKVPLQESINFIPFKKELGRIKSDPHYVRGLLRKQRTHPPVFYGMKVVTIGDPDGEHTLIVVSDPLCQRCAKTHREVELLVKNTPNLKCLFIFAVYGDSKAGIIARRILSLPESIMPEALSAWFETLDVKKWMKKMDTLENDDQGQWQLDLHHRWCELAGVTSVPLVFFDDIEIPSLYTVVEMENLIRILSYTESDQMVVD